MNPQILLISGISFAIGSFGYIIFHFFIFPILKYKKIRNQSISDLFQFNSLINTYKESDENPGNDFKRKIISYKKHAFELSECFDHILPEWYKLVLSKRKESPKDASKHLLALYNTKNFDHASARIKMIKLTLKFDE